MGKAGCIEQFGDQFRPLDGTLMAMSGGLQKAAGLEDALDPSRGEQGGGKMLAEEGVEGPLRAFQTALAQGPHGCLERRRFLWIGGHAGGKQPVQFVLPEWRGKPAEHQLRGVGRGSLDERNPERKLEERRGSGIGEPEKGAFDLAAAGAGFLGDDEQACIRSESQPSARPESASSEFGLSVGGGVEMDLDGRKGRHSFLPTSPGVEKAALEGENAVESGQKKGRALARIRFQHRNQFEGQPAGAEEVCADAGLVEGGEPGAEGRRVLLPRTSCFLCKENWGVRAKQLVGFHGQRGQAMARTLEQRGQRAVLGRDLDPESFFLRGVEQQAAVALRRGALLPSGARKALPVLDVGNRPGGEALGLPGAMEGRNQCAGGAFAGCNHPAAAQKPPVDLARAFGCLRHSRSEDRRYHWIKSPIPALYAVGLRKSQTGGK